MSSVVSNVIFSIEFLISFKTLDGVALTTIREDLHKINKFWLHATEQKREKRWSLNNIKIFVFTATALLYSCSLCNSIFKGIIDDRSFFFRPFSVVVFGRSAW
jgi:hypothetical protein